MTDAEERVAKALHMKLYELMHHPSGYCSKWDGLPEQVTVDGVVDLVALARAAIAAVRAYDAETLSSVVLGKDGEVETCA